MGTYNFSDIPLLNVKGVLIDLDDTIYKYTPAHNHALECVYKEIFQQYDYDYSSFCKLYRNARTEITQRLSPQGACRSRLFAFQELFEQLKTPHPFIAAYQADEIYWNQFIYKMECAHEALNFLRKCHAQNIPVCIVSDMTSHIQIRKIQKLRLEKYISHLVTSEETGAEKPASNMFLTAMQKLGLQDPKSVIMIGDSLTKDIEGATHVGVTAYHIDLYSPTLQ